MALRRILTYDVKKGRRVLAGLYDPLTSIFYKKVSPKHYMIKERGYGIQEEVVKILQQLECKTIHIETKTALYSFAFEEILKRVPKNYGHGLQRFLSVK